MMKYFILLTIVLASCKTAQKINYTSTYNEKNEKVLKGIINKSLIENDTTFSWFANNYKYAQPTKNAIATFNAKKNKFKLIVFGGTWCEDTHNLLPTFYKLINASNFSEKKITLVGVDRQKQSGNELAAKYNIKNIPCFIILKNDNTEVGRVVEYGKGNGIDVELAEIVNANFK